MKGMSFFVIFEEEQKSKERLLGNVLLRMYTRGQGPLAPMNSTQNKNVNVLPTKTKLSNK